MRRRFSVVLAVLSALNAQQPGAGRPLASDGVVVDVAADGVPWARGRDWKAHWRDGWCVSRPAGNHEDLSIRLAEVTVGSETVVVGAQIAARTGGRVKLSHPGLIEAWAASPATLEQSFRCGCGRRWRSAGQFAGSGRRRTRGIALAWQQAGNGPRLAVFDRAGQVRLRSGFAIPGTTSVIGDLDSDGSRFAIVATATPIGGGPARTMATAVAWRSDFATLRVDLQERPFVGGDPESDPAVYALRSSAGASSGAVYGIVHRRLLAGGPRLELAIWDGRQPGPQLVVREPHCGGIPANAFTIVGSCVIGDELWFDMPAEGFSGFMVGTSANLQIPVCNCQVGVIDANMVANPYVTILPSEPTLVGAMFSTQGYIIGPRSSACLGVIDLSYTIDITIR